MYNCHFDENVISENVEKKGKKKWDRWSKYELVMPAYIFAFTFLMVPSVVWFKYWINIVLMQIGKSPPKYNFKEMIIFLSTQNFIALIDTVLIKEIGITQLLTWFSPCKKFVRLNTYLNQRRCDSMPTKVLLHEASFYKPLTSFFLNDTL